jgi:hypothetical protein
LLPTAASCLLHALGRGQGRYSAGTQAQPPTRHRAAIGRPMAYRTTSQVDSAAQPTSTPFICQTNVHGSHLLDRSIHH